MLFSPTMAPSARPSLRSSAPRSIPDLWAASASSGSSTSMAWLSKADGNRARVIPLMPTHRGRRRASLRVSLERAGDEAGAPAQLGGLHIEGGAVVLDHFGLGHRVQDQPD